MLNKPTIYIVLGIVIGIAFAKLFTATTPCLETTAITKPSLLKEETSKKAIHFQKKVDSLNLVAKDIDNKLTNKKTALAISKNKTPVLQTQLLAANERVIGSDGETEVLNCSPEENLLAEFIQANDNKDSLYETIDSTRIVQLQNKDASLEVKYNMYHALEQSFNYNLSQQELLFTQNKLLRKQITRQKLKGKIVSAVILIVSASAAHFLIKQ